MRLSFGTPFSALSKKVIQLAGYAAIFCFLLFGNLYGRTQTIPNFTSGGKTPLLTGSSPSLAYLNGYMYVAYEDTSSNAILNIARSTDGVNWINVANTNVTTVGPVTMCACNGRLLIVYGSSTYGSQFSEISSSDGINYSSPQILAINGLQPSTILNSLVPPALQYFNGKIYLGFVAATQITGAATATVASSTDGINFANVVSLSNPSNSGLSAAVFGGKLYFAYTTNSLNRPVLAATADGTTFTYGIDSTFEVGGTPALAVFTPSGGPSALYIFGRSNFSENNLWVAGTFDGSAFSAAYQYGPSLNFNPAIAILGNGYLVSAFHANLSGKNIWTYVAPN